MYPRHSRTHSTRHIWIRREGLAAPAMDGKANTNLPILLSRTHSRTSRRTRTSRTHSRASHNRTRTPRTHSRTYPSYRTRTSSRTSSRTSLHSRTRTPRTSLRTSRFVSYNVHGLNDTKVRHLGSFMMEHNVVAMGLQETFFRRSHSGCFTHHGLDNGIERLDLPRPSSAEASQGGGVSLLLHPVLATSWAKLGSPVFTALDLLAVRVQLGPRRMVLAVWYLPPNALSGPDLRQRQEESLMNLSRWAASEEIVFLSDMNAQLHGGLTSSALRIGSYGYYRSLHNTGSGAQGRLLVRHLAKFFNHRVASTFFCKSRRSDHITFSQVTDTRTQRRARSMIDFILVPVSMKIRNAGVLKSLDVGSDHRPVFTDIAFSRSRPQQRRRKRIRRQRTTLDFSALDSATFRQDLRQRLTNNQFSWPEWRDQVLSSLRQANLPQRRESPLDWFSLAQSQGMDRALANKARARNALFQAPATSSRDELLALRGKYRRFSKQVALIRKDAHRRLHSKILGIASDARMAWRHIIDAITTTGGKEINRGARTLREVGASPQLVTAFIAHFASTLAQTADLDESTLRSIPQKPVSSSLAAPPSLIEVTKVLEALSASTATRKGSIPTPIVKLFLPRTVGQKVINDDRLLRSLTGMLQSVWTSGQIPEDWTLLSLTLIPKTSPPSTIPKQWRGIFTMPLMAKIFSAVVQKRLSRHFEVIYGSSERQHGFRTNRGTHSALTRVIQSCRARAAAGRATWIGFLDIQKAFPSLQRKVIYTVLRKAGIPGHLCKIIRSLHTNVQAQIRIGSRTKLLPVRSGVKQGCPLGPVIFNYVMQAMIEIQGDRPGVSFSLSTPDSILRGAPRMDGGRSRMPDSSIVTIDDTCFADDIAFLSTSRDDCSARFDSWIRTLRQFGLDPNLASGKSNFVVTYPQGSSSIPDTIGPVHRATSYTYLGFVIQEDLRGLAEANVRTRLRSARAALASIQDFCRDRAIPTRTKGTVYKVLVMPILLYAAPLWGPLSPELQATLRLFHNTATRTVTSTPLWKHRLLNISLDTLRRRAHLAPIEHTMRVHTLRFFAKAVESGDIRHIFGPERERPRIGDIVRKTFTDGIFRGTVRSTPGPGDPWYKIAYEDGDSEDLTCGEIRSLQQGRYRCNALRRSFHRVISDHLGSRSKSDISIFRKAFGSRRQANSVHSGLDLSLSGIFRLLHTSLWHSFVGRAHKSFQIDRTSRTSSWTS